MSGFRPPYPNAPYNMMPPGPGPQGPYAPQNFYPNMNMQNPPPNCNQSYQNTNTDDLHFV